MSETKALKDVVSMPMTYEDNHNDRCMYCDGYLGTLGHKEDCIQKQAAKELEELIHAWTWLCKCGYVNNIPVCTHCGTTYSGNLTITRSDNALLRKQRDEAMEVMELANSSNQYKVIEAATAFLKRMKKEKI
jgi:CDGSH-type Zn-finger protein